MNIPARELDKPESPRAAAQKFTYPSGARPLEGYTIKRGVGHGGFGEVYFATSDAGKEVALKLIRRNLEVELRGVTQCLNLKHPNLVALYDIRTDEAGDQWVVMEYVSGESLEDVIDRHPQGMPEDEVRWWMQGVCAGVAYLHDHGIVHRDLKPGNIFSDEGLVKIGDYGLAKFISCSRRSGQTESVGTVHYMAPEIANGRYGREIDTYALGVILFEMLSGRVPFEGESVGEVLMKHLTAEPDLSVLREPYRDIVRRALAKDPAVRINSVGELMSLLPGADGAAGVSAASPAVSSPPPASPASPGGILQDADARARDGWEKAAHLVRQADRQAASVLAASDGQPIEEPIWKALREHFTGEKLQTMHPLKKALLVFALVALAIWYMDVVFSLVIPAAVCYGIYYVVWTNWLRPGATPPHSAAASAGPKPPPNATAAPGAPPSAPSAANRAAAAGANTAERRRRIRPGWRELARQELAAKPLRDKTRELLGSMLLAAVFAALAACAAPLLLAQQPTSEVLAMYLWLALVGTLGSWAILVPAKFAEGTLEDQVPLRLTMLICGTLVGLAGWVLGSVLLLHSPGWGEPVDVGRGLVSHELLRWPALAVSTSPSVATFIAYFAFLFVVPRWWRQAEYTRPARLSLWWIIVCVFWAWLLHIFWHFPQPTGMLVAGVVAVATQLASPWMPPSRRRALAGQFEGGTG